jgi:hypothetical protein
MKVTKTFIPYLAIALIATTFTNISHARIKCWTNNDGVKECGDRVPPEYSQKGHKEISDQGVVIEEKERAKTEEELEEQRKLDAIKAEEEHIVAEKEKHDQILLRTFGSVDEVELARDGKIAALESSITLANKRNEKLQGDMDTLLEKAAEAESGGEAPPEVLMKDIESKERQVKNNKNFIEEKRAEQESIRQAYAVDIARFKSLKGIE